MPVVFTDWMLRRLTAAAITGAAVTIDSVRYGKRAREQVVDATAAAIALQDPNPDVARADIIAPTTRGTTVQHRLNVNSTGARRLVTEVGLFVGENLAIYEADANTVLFEQPADDNVLKVLAYTILQDGTPTGLSLELLGAQRTELFRDDDYAWTNDVVKRVALAEDWSDFDFLDVYVSGLSDDRNVAEFVGVGPLRLQDQLIVGQAWDSAANRAIDKIVKSTPAGALALSRGANGLELRVALDGGAGVTGRFSVHGVKYKGLKGDGADPPELATAAEIRAALSGTDPAAGIEGKVLSLQQMYAARDAFIRDNYTTMTQAQYDALTNKVAGRMYNIRE